MADIQELVAQMVQMRGSDLHLKAGSPPFVRVSGRLQRTNSPALRPADTEAMATAMLPADRAGDFHHSGEADFALGISGVGRFRVSLMRQRGSISIMLKRVVTTPPSFDALGLPPVVRQLADRRSGLVLVTGLAGSGRSTTLASMVDHLNTETTASIVTVENPIEVLHPDKRAFISQREVGTDATDYASAVHRALRHDADVIFVDQIPNAEVMGALLTAASGRLVLSSLNSITAEDTVRTIVDFFPPNQAAQTRQSLASVLEGIISQRLIDREEGPGRVAAFELMVMTPRIHDSIVQAQGAANIESLIEGGDYYGMQTMDQHLSELYQRNLISMRDALSAATHPQDLRVQLSHMND